MFGGIHRAFSRFGKTALVLGIFIGGGLLLFACIPSLVHAAEPYQAPDSAFPSAFINLIGTTLANFINMIGNGIGSLTLVIIEAIVINVLNYNNFASSNIVTLGWTLTRDMVNMFAVIVLLVLAIKTMINETPSAWQQHLPRFFLGIVFANFSRTICGLAVDASQIIMMTFVNALMGIAAGNFAQLMVMPQATTYSATTLQAVTEAGAQSAITLATNIANAYVKLMVQVAVMIVILLLAIAFIWRIIVLWIAFIMAPFAAFSWGSKEIVGYLGRVWQEWIGAFVPPLILGPMLAFFLYLALAASSNGNLAKTEAFPEPEDHSTLGQINLEVFESTNFTGLMLAIVFLLMGLKESAKTAAKMGGIASTLFNDKTGKRVLSLGARVSGATVGNVAKLGTRGVLKAGSLAGSGIELASNKIGSKMGSGTLGRAGRLGTSFVGGIAGAAGSLARRTDEQVRLIPTDVTKLSDYAKNRGAAVAKAGSELTTELGENLTKKTNTVSGKLGGAGQWVAGKIGASKDNSKKFGDMVRDASATGMLALGPNALRSAGSALGAQEHHVSEIEAKAAKERVSHMTQEEKAARLQQALDGTGEKSIEAMADAQHLKGILFNDKAFADSFKEASEKNEVGSFDRHIGKVLHDLQHEDEAGHLSVDKATWDKARNKYLDLYTHAASRENVQTFLKSDDFKSNMIRKEAVTNPDVIFALASSVTSDKKDGKFVTRLDQLNDRQKDQVQGASNAVIGSFKAGMFTEDPAAPGSGLNASGARIDDYARAFSRLDGDGATLNVATAAALEAQLRDIEADPARASNFHEDELAAIRKNLVQAAAATGGAGAAKAKLDASFAAGTTYNAAYNLSDRKKFKSLVREDPSSIRHIDDAALNDADHDVSKAIFDAMSKESFDKMKSMVDAGTRSSAQVDDALNKLKIVLDAKERKARNGVSEADIKASLADIKAAAVALKVATTADDRSTGEANLKAAQASHDATIAGMDKDAMDKIKALRSSLDATQRYI